MAQFEEVDYLIFIGDDGAVLDVIADVLLGVQLVAKPLDVRGVRAVPEDLNGRSGVSR